MGHDASHEALLARILAGDGAEHELGQCERCRRELEEARDADARARLALELEREVVEEARHSATRADRDHLSNLLERGRLSAARSRVRRLVLGVALVGAAALVALLTTRGPVSTPEVPREELRLGDSLACHVELRDGRYHAFAWEPVEEPEVSYELRLRALESGLAGEELLYREALSGARWEPTPEEERALPDELLMEVRAVSALGEDRGHGSSRVSRR